MKIIQRSLPCELDSEFYAPEGTIWFVAYEGDEWIGYGGIQVDPEWKPYLGPSYVRPEHRGKGVQKKLLAKRIDFLEDNGYTVCTTCALHHNIYSIRNIEKCGFTYTHTETTKLGGTLYWYERKLTPWI